MDFCQDCIISEKFVDETAEILKTTAINVIQSLNLTPENQPSVEERNNWTTNNANAMSFMRVTLVDGVFGKHVSIFPVNFRRGKNIAQKMLRILTRETESKCKTEFEPLNFACLSLATIAENYFVLESFLEKHGKDVPACCIQFLLLSCIRNRFKWGVELLLGMGASPKVDLKPGMNYFPLAFCVNSFIEMAESYPNSPSNFGSRAVSEIFELILSKNDVNSIFNVADSQNCCQILKYLPDIALISDQSAFALLNALPQPFNDGHLLKQIVDRFSTFYDPEKNYSLILGRIIKHAILPLLRSGSRSPSIDFSRICLGLYGSDEFDQASQRIWGRTNVIVEIDLELKPYKPGEASIKDNVIAQAYLPLNLAVICRRATLKYLPVGFPHRDKAIENLPIPPSLRDFLKFPEFDLCDTAQTVLFP